MSDLLKTWARHLIAALVGWLVPTLSGFGVALSPEQVGDLEQGLTSVGVVLLLAVYAVVEKALKPVWTKWLNENQLGETHNP